MDYNFLHGVYERKFDIADLGQQVMPGKQKLKLLKNCVEKIDKIRHKKFQQRLAKGEYNSEPIQFQRADNVKDAMKFAKKHKLVRYFRGVDKNSNADLELLNRVNEALCNIHNKTKGKSIMPSSVRICETLKSADNIPASAGYSLYGGKLFIPRNNTDLQLSTIYHEMGHANHFINVDAKHYSRLGEIAYNGGDKRITEAFLADNELQSLIKNRLRDYAASSPAEFVADMFSALMQGKKMPIKLHEAYRALKGPSIAYSA